MMGKGFYVALAVCLAGAGTAAWVTVNSTIDKIESPLSPTPPVAQKEDSGMENPGSPLSAPEKKEPAALGESIASVGEKKEDVKKPSSSEKKPSDKKPSGDSSKKPQPSSNSSSSAKEFSASVQPSEQQKQPAKSQTSSFALPLDTKVMAPFSGDKLVENTTLKDWRTHNGIDLKASKGDSVKSANEGKITGISFDPLWGTTVEVSSGDLVMTYCGLSEKVNVKMNDTIRAGEIIGTVGEIPCELALEPHLHFTVKEKGVFIDPLSLLS